MTLLEKLKFIKGLSDAIQEEHKEEISNFVGRTGAFIWPLQHEIDGLDEKISGAITVLGCDEKPCTLAEADFRYEQARDV